MHWTESITFDNSLATPEKNFSDGGNGVHAAHEIHYAIKSVIPEMADVMTKSYSIQGNYMTAIDNFGLDLHHEIPRIVSVSRLCLQHFPNN